MTNLGERAASQVACKAKPTRAAVVGYGGVLKQLLEEHSGVFARVKQLGLRSDERLPAEFSPGVPIQVSTDGVAEIAALYAALRDVRTELSSHNDTDPTGLADAMALLDAINPGSPEWAPAFLHVSELVEAHLTAEEDPLYPRADERQSSQAACLE
jgi:hypothetical protein